MNNVNYAIFLNYIKAFADAHLQVKRFASDFVDQLQNFGSAGVSYPLLYVAPATYNFKPNQWTASRFNELTVNIYCIDLLLDDRSNVNPILNTTSCILNDLFKWLTEGLLPGVDVVRASGLRPLNNYTMESCAGWVMTLTVDLSSYGICEIPFAYDPVLITNEDMAGNTGGNVPGPGPGPTPGPGPGPGPTPDPGGNNWRLNYSIFSGVTTPNYGGPPLTCNWTPLNGVAQNNGSFQIGLWNTVIPFQLENEIQYMGSLSRNFSFAASISMSTPQPSTIEYSYRISEGFTGSQGQFIQTPGATGIVTTGGVAHAPVVLTGLWNPSVQGDLFGLTVRFCGSPAQTLTLASANVTITEIP